MSSSLIQTIRTNASEKARAIYDDALVWDMTLPWGGDDYGDAEGILPRFHAAGIDVASLTIAGIGLDFNATMRWMAKVNRDIEARSDSLVLCRSVADISGARANGKLALFYNLQETLQFEHRIELIKFFYDLGVRYALLAYNVKNAVGDGCAERTDAGLSRWGIEVVNEMNRVGMLVDGTHCGYNTTMDAMEVSTTPFIFSHSNAYSVFPHYRNIRDDQIKACAKSGGVIGINGLGEFLDDHEASSQSMFRHIDYIANLVGPEHVGIGLDYVLDVDSFWEWVRANPFMWPENEGQKRSYSRFSQPEQLLEIVDLLLEHGYSETDIRNILGENFKRVCEQVWR